MSTTTNDTSNDTPTRPDEGAHEYPGGCIVGCGWYSAGIDFPDLEHPGYCERSVGSSAAAVTEPGWHRVQFWCSVISPHLQGKLTDAEADASRRHRDGVQLALNIWDVPESEVGDDGNLYRELHYNLTPGEARQLAAQLIGAADSSDGLNDSHHVMRRLEKIAKRVGADIYGP